jgi:hypothetical protein
VRGARLISADLPTGIVPYVFPLMVANGNAAYARLRSRGIGMGRWDQIVTDVCPVARRYAETLFHLPCHQGLSREQLAGMVAALDSLAG